MAWNLDDDRRRRRLRFFDMVTAFYTLARRASAPLQQVCRPAVPLLADRWRGLALAAWKQRNRLASLAHRTAVRIEAERTPQQSGGLRFVWFPVRTLPVVSARTPASQTHFSDALALGMLWFSDSGTSVCVVGASLRCCLPVVFLRDPISDSACMPAGSVLGTFPKVVHSFSGCGFSDRRFATTTAERARECV